MLLFGLREDSILVPVLEATWSIPLQAGPGVTSVNGQMSFSSEACLLCLVLKREAYQGILAWIMAGRNPFPHSQRNTRAFYTPSPSPCGNFHLKPAGIEVSPMYPGTMVHMTTCRQTWRLLVRDLV